jgi:hypothetical protein
MHTRHRIQYIDMAMFSCVLQPAVTCLPMHEETFKAPQPTPRTSVCCCVLQGPPGRVQRLCRV